MSEIKIKYKARCKTCFYFDDTDNNKTTCNYNFPTLEGRPETKENNIACKSYYDWVENGD